MRVTVNFPVIFDAPDELISDEIYDTQERIKDHAGYLLETSTVKPIIVACEDKRFEEQE